MFQEITDFKTISLSGYLIALMHYPMLSWPKSHHGSLMLHGHVHGRREDNERNREAGIRRYDVGVDANDYFPVEVKRIFQFFDLS
jgi:calcineurin-like phosphoesterase family protein